MWTETELLVFCRRVWKEHLAPDRIVTVEGLGQVRPSSLAPGSVHIIDGTRVMIGREKG